MNNSLSQPSNQRGQTNKKRKKRKPHEWDDSDHPLHEKYTSLKPIKQN